MVHASETLRLAQQPRRRHVTRVRRLEQLQRHVAIEPRVVGPIHRAEGPFPDLFADDQMTPSLEALVTFWWFAGIVAVFGIDMGAVKGGDLRDQSQIAHAPARAVVANRSLDLLPVDGTAVGHRFDEGVERGAFSAHGPAPR